MFLVKKLIYRTTARLHCILQAMALSCVRESIPVLTQQLPDRVDRFCILNQAAVKSNHNLPDEIVSPTSVSEHGWLEGDEEYRSEHGPINFARLCPKPRPLDAMYDSDSDSSINRDPSARGSSCPEL